MSRYERFPDGDPQDVSREIVEQLPYALAMVGLATLMMILIYLAYCGLIAVRSL